MVDDPFGAADLRAAVLDAWAASPTRFREDANAEEDLVRGGYRDRLLVELIQNGLDASAPQPARVAVSITSDALLVANSGRPLTAEGVTALASLRASAKRDDEHAIGRFGVGFAAVLAVTDAPMVASTTGVVSFSAGRTRSLVGAIPGLGAELTRREGGVPVLRLPFEVVDVPPDVSDLLAQGWTTVVRLPFRNPNAAELAGRLLSELDPVLPVLFDGLAELVLPDRTIERTVIDGGDLLVDGTRWRLARRTGEHAAEDLATQPAESRRSHWWTLAAAPIDDDGALVALPKGVTPVLRAPQETQEQHSLPVVLGGSFQLDPDRRRLRDDATQRMLVAELAGTVADLAGRLVPTPALLELMPPGIPMGPQDAALRSELEDLLRRTPIFPGATSMREDSGALLHNRGFTHGEGRRVGVESQALDLGHATVTTYPLLAEVTGEFLPPDWPASHRSYRALGVRQVDTRRLVAWLIESSVRPEPAWWGRLAAALTDAPDHDALGSLPVPLADGTYAIGPRGVVVANPGLDLAGLVSAGVELRVLHPDAANPAWLRLGVVVADPASILRDDRLAAAVLEEARALREDDIEPDSALSECVLQLVASGGATGDLPWLAELILRADDGSAWPARELLMPDSPLYDLIEDPVTVAADIVDRHGPGALAALGVAEGFAVTSMQAAVDDGAVNEDEVEEWLDGREQGFDLTHLKVIRDLDLIRPERWTAALQLIASDRETRLAVMHGESGGSSFPAWQIIRTARINGLPLNEFCIAADPTIAGIFPSLPVDLDVEFATAIGVHTNIADVISSPDLAWDLLDRIGDEDIVLDRATVRDLYTGLADSLGHRDGAPPLAVRAVVDGELRVVATSEVVVVDRPDLVGLIGTRPYVPVAMSRAGALSQLLRVPLASRLGSYDIVSVGTDDKLGGHRFVRHDRLQVTDADGGVREVSWRVPDPAAGVIHATGAEGLGRALAFLRGEWVRRDLIVASLRDPSILAAQLSEEDLEEAPDPR